MRSRKCDWFAYSKTTEEVARFECPRLYKARLIYYGSKQDTGMIRTSSSRVDVPKRGATMSAKCKTLHKPKSKCTE